MKSLRLSLVTALALGTAAFAEDKAAMAPSLVLSHGTLFDNMKVGGQATLYYQTLERAEAVDGGDFSELFNKNSGFANVGLSLKFESDLGNDFGFGAKLNVLDTLGLEDELVEHVMQHTGDPEDSEVSWGEVYLTKKAGNTLLTVGRQELDTPLLYSEKWSVIPNSFEAVVAINSDLADQGLTLVGAYVTTSNNLGGKPNGMKQGLGQFDRVGRIVTDDGAVLAEGHGGYAVGALYGNDSVKANAWGYHLPATADAFWIDASTEVAGINLTGQLAGFMLEDEPTNGVVKSDKNTMGYALQGCMNVTPEFKFTLAGAQTTGGVASHTVSNVGTGGFKTKLATATIVGDGDVAGATDTTSFKLKGSYSLGEKSTLIAQYGHYMHGAKSSVSNGYVEGATSFMARKADESSSALELIYKGQVLATDVLVAYSHADNIMQMTYVGETSDLIRVVARYNF